ncbi:hypothetical protein [Flavobacterium alvei]|nr:hypothetical protein [Flavobacterium alvei]
MVYHLEKISQEKVTYLMLSASSIIIIFFSIITTLVNAYNKRFEKDDYIISFNEDKDFISTDTTISCYNYLGETSSPDGASVPLVNTNKSNYIQNCNWHERDARASKENERNIN